jgi:hypothetical protein
MDRNEFVEILLSVKDDSDAIDLCRRSMLHGTPFLFLNREDDFYRFRKRIAEKFEIHFHEVYIVGSAKLGFSPYKGTKFDLDSDVDVAIVSTTLYDRIFDEIWKLQREIRASRRSISNSELQRYHSFLEYSAIGWMRPDKLPYSVVTAKLRRDWFDFFGSISNGRSEAGNYEVSGGVFKTYNHLERYTLDSLMNARNSIKVA